MKENTMIRDFTKGNLPGQMLRFSVPFMISNALQVVYAIVDMIVVGNVLGSPGLAAVATASQVSTLMTMVCLGFSTGAQVYISQLIGAGRQRELNATIGTMTSMLALMGAVIGALGLLFAPWILTLLNTPDVSFDMAVSYLRICAGGILVTYGYNAVSAVLRGMGDSVQPCIYIIIAALVNLGLDLWFVRGLGWGVPGAAIATIIGQAVSFFTAVVHLYRNREAFGFDFRRESFRIDRPVAQKLTGLGLPMALRSASVNISMLFVTGLVNSVGPEAASVFGVGLKVDDVAHKISMGVNYSVSTVTGQNFAARNFKRTEQAVWWGWFYSLIIYLIFTVAYVSDIEGLFRLFTQEQAVLDLAPVFVRAILWSFPAMLLMRGANGLIQGIGNARLSFIFAVLDSLVLRIGLSYLLGVVLGHGLYGFILGYGLAAYGTAIPGTIYFFSGIWKRRAPYLAEPEPQDTPS